MNKKQRDQIRN